MVTPGVPVDVLPEVTCSVPVVPDVPEVVSPVPDVTSSVPVVPDEVCVSIDGVCRVHLCRMVRDVSRVVSQSGRVHARVSWKCLLKTSLSELRTASGSNGDNRGAYQIFQRKDRVEGMLA